MLFTALIKQKLTVVVSGKLYVHCFLFESGEGGSKISFGQATVAFAGAMLKEAQLCRDV